MADADFTEDWTIECWIVGVCAGFVHAGGGVSGKVSRRELLNYLKERHWD